MSGGVGHRFVLRGALAVAMLGGCAGTTAPSAQPTTPAPPTAPTSTPVDATSSVLPTTLPGSPSPGPTVTAACAAAPSGIATWWPADDGGSVLVGGQAGVVEGDPAVVEGHVGSALELAAQVDSVSFDGAGELDLGDDGVTIEAWLRLGENTAGGQNFTASIGKNVFPIAQPYLLTFEGGPIQGGAGPTLPADQWQMEYVLTRSDGTRVHDQRTGLIVTVDGQFHHYAMTYDGSTVRLFIDGVQRYESPFGGDLLSVPEVPLTIGGGAAFAIDEMTIYGRALTAAELAAIQTAASGGKCRPTSS